MKLLYCIFFLSLFVDQAQSVYDLNQVEFSDFNAERDSAMLEHIFKEDYNLLERYYKTFLYEKGRGVNMFKICSALGQQQGGGGGKILRILDDNITRSVAFVTYFIAKDISAEKGHEHILKGDGCLPCMGVLSNYQGKNYRRKKLGSIALSYVLNFFRENDCENVWLSVKDWNNNAQNLYQKFGFKATCIKSSEESTWWILNLKKQQSSQQ